MKSNYNSMAAPSMVCRNQKRHACLFGVATMLLAAALLVDPSLAFVPAMRKTSKTTTTTTSTVRMMDNLFSDQDTYNEKAFHSCTISERRPFLHSLITSTAAATALVSTSSPHPAMAAEETTTTTKSTSDATITSKIYIDLKGIPPPEGTDPTSTTAMPKTDRITIGLFGNEAPQPISILLQLVSPDGLPAKCKPLESRTLQREQLEANKVYNSCMETQDSRGVTYDLSSVWRVDRGKRIDLGAVSGKFVSRVNPTFEENSGNVLKHDAPGVVSVRKGNDGGFGFTIYPGGPSKPTELDEDNIVVGKILEGMDVVERLNNVPVVQSSSVNYMGLTGGPKGKNAPSRACRYGGPMYCNELKPLKKILIESTGVL